MTVSTDGQICYGIRLVEADLRDTPLPWDVEPYNGDIEDWWIYGVNKFEHSLQLYDSHGDYLNGVKPTKEQTEEYWGEKRRFFSSHPLPVFLVNACSGDYPEWILATGEIFVSANRGYPQAFEPSSLVAGENDRDLLIEFCKTHEIEINDEEPRWWLSSYWG